MKKNKKQEKIRKILSKLDKEVLRISVQAELKNSEETGVRKLMQTMPPVGVPNRYAATCKRLRDIRYSKKSFGVLQ